MFHDEMAARAKAAVEAVCPFEDYRILQVPPLREGEKRLLYATKVFQGDSYQVGGTITVGHSALWAVYSFDEHTGEVVRLGGEELQAAMARCPDYQARHNSRFVYLPEP